MRSRPLRTSVEIPGPLRDVRDLLSSIEDHVEWMADAVSIDFHDDLRRGEGDSFSCATRIGPFTTTDETTIDEWIDNSAIGVTHRGAATGSGRFELTAVTATDTRVTWTESLSFPRWLGGLLGERVPAPLFHWIWNQDLDRLRARVLAR